MPAVRRAIVALAATGSVAVAFAVVSSPLDEPIPRARAQAPPRRASVPRPPAASRPAGEPRAQPIEAPDTNAPLEAAVRADAAAMAVLRLEALEAQLIDAPDEVRAALTRHRDRWTSRAARTSEKGAIP